MKANDPQWLTSEMARSVLVYDPDSGAFRWANYMNRLARAGAVAGKKTASGYWSLRLRRKEIMAHRLAWLIVNGEWPSGEVDHINGQRDDNRMKNLRVVSRSENMQNRHKARSSAKSGLLGAYVCTKGGWYSCITRNGVRRYLGRFDTAEAAHAAYIGERSAA